VKFLSTVPLLSYVTEQSTVNLQLNLISISVMDILPTWNKFILNICCVENRQLWSLAIDFTCLHAHLHTM